MAAVYTAEELQRAFHMGIRDIEIRAHLDLRNLAAETADPIVEVISVYQGPYAIGVVGTSTRSIRVCLSGPLLLCSWSAQSCVGMSAVKDTNRMYICYLESNPLTKSCLEAVVLLHSSVFPFDSDACRWHLMPTLSGFDYDDADFRLHTWNRAVCMPDARISITFLYIRAYVMYIAGCSSTLWFIPGAYPVRVYV